MAQTQMKVSQDIIMEMPNQKDLVRSFCILIASSGKIDLDQLKQVHFWSHINNLGKTVGLGFV